MLANVPVCATLPTTDLEGARRFYGETLGLAEGPIGVTGGVFFEAGGGTIIRIYERSAGHTAAEYTVAGFPARADGRNRDRRARRDPGGRADAHYWWQKVTG